MIRAQSCDIGQCRKRDVLRKVRFDVLHHFLLLPAGEATTNRPLGEASAAVETQQLVHEYDAQRLHILLLPGPRIHGLRFELERGFPQVVVEEEESWRELAFGETQFGIDQRTVRIDVEIGDACQLARLLPAAKPVAGGHEGQLPVELLQGRPRQAFDERFAVVALAALAHDQELYSNGSRLTTSTASVWIPFHVAMRRRAISEGANCTTGRGWASKRRPIRS